MRSFSFPDNFDPNDRENVLQAISIAQQQVKVYEGDFTASWLLSPYHSVEWITRNQGREEFIDGEWKNAIRQNWDIVLPNGLTLVDPKYERTIDVNRRIAFFRRSGLLGECLSTTTWKPGVAIQLLITRYAVLNESRYEPEKYGFKLLDQNAINSLLRALATGGWFEALQIPNRFLSQIYNSVYGEPCPQSLYDVAYQLPDIFIKEMVEWLRDNKYYAKVVNGQNAGFKFLNRQKLAVTLNEEHYILGAGAKPNYFFRQFEPDFKKKLLVIINQKTEYPDQKTQICEEVVKGKMSESTVKFTANVLRTLLSGYRQIPELIPAPGLISIKTAVKVALNHTKGGSHHLFIPINVGLGYFNNAMRIVELYGKAIVDHVIAVISMNDAIQKDNIRGKRDFIDNDIDIYKAEISHSTIAISKSLGIKKMKNKDKDKTFEQLRSNPTLEEALQILIGACVVCIAIPKPSRETEITHLKRNCLVEKSDGYHLSFTLGKANKITEKRPIPVITAKAIQLLQTLGDAISNLYRDKRKTYDNLFYIPNLTEGGTRVANSALLNSHLDIFCDYVALPPDDLGRRWLVRVHEMRKWFLLLLFWSGRFDVLDALRWIAGHTNAEHIYAYIEREFPGEELPQLEAEYAVTRLKELDRAKGASRSESGLETLYESVLSHFKVQSLSMIPESEWADYIESLREATGFHLEPHTIYGENNEVVGLNVSFVLREVSA